MELEQEGGVDSQGDLNDLKSIRAGLSLPLMPKHDGCSRQKNHETAISNWVDETNGFLHFGLFFDRFVWQLELERAWNFLGLGPYRVI